jgi:hypothetical protein
LDAAVAFEKRGAAAAGGARLSPLGARREGFIGLDTAVAFEGSEECSSRMQGAEAEAEAEAEAAIAAHEWVQGGSARFGLVGRRCAGARGG